MAGSVQLAFHIKIHENTTISYFVDVSVFIRELHQKKNLVLVLLVPDMM